jgi:predicted amidophosphoribosyltransferase
MATYKQNCIHCGTLVERDARFCPTCLREIEKGSQMLCAGCGRPLYIVCPICGGRTFVQEKCEACGSWLVIRCKAKNCGVIQFFENEKCTACGKKIKPKDRVLTPVMAQQQ